MNKLKCATCTGQDGLSLKKFGYTPRGAATLQRIDVFECDEGHYTTENGAPVGVDDVVPAGS